MAELEVNVLSKKEFTLQNLERSSYAAKYLYLWIVAISNYSKVWVKSLPLRAKYVEILDVVE